MLLASGAAAAANRQRAAQQRSEWELRARACARLQPASGESFVRFSLLISLSPTSDSARSPPSIILALKSSQKWRDPAMIEMMELLAMAVQVLVFSSVAILLC